jgi:ribose transport system permease protein
MVVFIMLLGISLALSLLTDTFLTFNNIYNVARNFSWIAVVALGESLVIITGGIDLSVGAVMALSGVVSAFCLRAGFSAPLSILAGLFAGGLVGWINGLLVGHNRLPAFIVTLASMSVARGIIFGTTGGWPLRELPDTFRFLGQDLLVAGIPIPTSLVVMILLTLVIVFILRYTAIGTYIYALGDSERALTVAGVNPAEVKVLVYVLCSLLAAAGGLLMTARVGVAAPNAATGYELLIIAAAVIGGTSLFGGEGGVWGVLIGAAVLQVLHNGLVLFGLAAHWQTTAIGMVVLVALLADYYRRQRLLKVGE